MAAFEYVALDDTGRTRRGVLTGDSARQIRSRMREMGLYPVKVLSVNYDSTMHAGFHPGRRISSTVLALLTRQLATLIRAGMPLDDSLQALGSQVHSRRLKSVLAGVRAQIAEGSSLHEALAAYPGVFPELYRSMVEAGEVSGRLEEVLERLADYTESRRALHQTISMALVYPAILTVVSLLVVSVLLIYVVPEMVRVFEQTGQSLPLLTSALISASHIFRSFGWLICGATLAIILFWWWLLGHTSIRKSWDRLMLKLPYAGRLIRIIHTARLTRTLAILTKSGVPLLEAIEISARMVSNIPLRQAVNDAAGVVREGGRLHSALDNSDLFPPLMIQMLASGEEAGELDDMLERAASQQEHEWQTIIAATTKLFEPVIILIMGAVVLVIVLAILLPIFEMNQLVGL